MKAHLSSSTKGAVGSRSRQRRKEILVVLSQSLRVSVQHLGPAVGQASLCELCFSLSAIMRVHTISQRRAIRVQLHISTGPRTYSCLLTTPRVNLFFYLFEPVRQRDMQYRDSDAPFFQTDLLLQEAFIKHLL